VRGGAVAINLKTAVETRRSRPFDFTQGGLSLPNGRRTQSEDRAMVLSYRRTREVKAFLGINLT